MVGRTQEQQNNAAEKTKEIKLLKKKSKVLGRHDALWQENLHIGYSKYLGCTIPLINLPLGERIGSGVWSAK